MSIYDMYQQYMKSDERVWNRLREKVQTEMGKQFDKLQYAYIEIDSENYEKRNLKIYAIVLGLSIIGSIIIYWEMYIRQWPQMIYQVLLWLLIFQIAYFSLDLILFILHRIGWDKKSIWYMITCCEKVVGYVLLIFSAEMTLVWIILSLFFKRIHMDKILDNNAIVIFALSVSFTITVLSAVYLYRYFIDIKWISMTQISFVTVFGLGMFFWELYKILLWWCCKWMQIEADYPDIVEETKVIFMVFFWLTLVFIYGVNWGYWEIKLDDVGQHIIEVITVVLLMDTIDSKIKANG